MIWCSNFARCWVGRSHMQDERRVSLKGALQLVACGSGGCHKRAAKGLSLARAVSALLYNS
jgi:hypothetical protein